MDTPADLHADLTADRLAVVTKLVIDVRNEAVDHHRPEQGETRWSLGCRYLERLMYNVTEATKTHPWLRVLDGSRHFRFMIGSVPVGVYRGRPQEPRGGALKSRHPELTAVQEAFPFYLPKSEMRVRIAIETDENGRPTSVHVVRLDGDAPHNVWALWPIAAASRVAGVHKLRGAPAKLPRPTLTSKKKKDTGEGGQASGDAS